MGAEPLDAEGQAGFPGDVVHPFWRGDGGCWGGRHSSLNGGCVFS